MSNSYFNNSRTLLPLSKARADDVESKFDLVGAGFDAAEAAVNLKAPLASPGLTGTPTAPTAAAGTNTTQLATTAHVFAERSNAATLTNKTLTSPVINSPTGLVKGDVGLGNVDNTSDLSKPVSTATQSALDLKAPLASPALTGVPTAPTAATGTNTTQIATTAFVTQTAFASTLPDQTGNTGKYLTTNGTAASWSTVNFGAGTVTSVAASVPSFLSVAGSPITASGTLAISLSGNALPETSGGTGQTSYAVGDLLYAGTTTTLTKLPDVTTGNALLSGGVNTAPAWGKVGLSTHVSGTLPAANGGTGLASYAAGDLLYASASNTLSTLGAAATGNALISGGAGNPPSWGKISLATGSQHVTGTLPVGNGGTGAITLPSGGVLVGNGTSAVSSVAPGTQGNVLASDGYAWVSQALSIPTSLTTEVLTSGTSWTVPAGVTTVKATIVGGGGSGAHTTVNAAGPGASGSVVVKKISGLTPGATIACAIGAGGAGVTADDTNGNQGGNTTFNSVTAGGGGYGGVTGGTAANNASSSGDLVIVGGSKGVEVTAANGYTCFGGDAALGLGFGGVIENSSTMAEPRGYGAGGAGKRSTGGTSQAGLNGCIILEY